MRALTPELLQLAALSGAFWTALWLYRGAQPLRFVAALGLGAGLAHLGWALLHLPIVLRHPWSLLGAAGFSALFVPLGLLALTPTAASLAPLPLALAVARLGCLAAGCCHGPRGEPTPLLAMTGLALLHLVVRRLPERRVVGSVLAGLGGVRLATEPWRAPPPSGEPLIQPSAIAALWMALGLVAVLLGGVAPATRGGAGSTARARRAPVRRA